ncbi:secretin N-terminal domain-containing protein [Pseudomonas sp. H9]|uniref:secretin N-terminal domain-containing protein n=1 Tax=Pseudomonas sp. H9 TaxID=483968 RepID=UPI002113C74C|nr:secretin N-terminal domain-containing protein [Pseudomonas sp. H9]
MPLRPLLTSLLLSFSLSSLAATEVLPLNHRTSAELLPTAQSFLGKEGSVSAFENKLIVNADPQRIDDLRTLLQQLDTAPRRLMISVDNNDSNYQDNRGNARIIHYGTANREGGLQQVQATEGNPALIQVGQSIPITSTSTDGYGRIQSDTEYRNVTQGFYVTAKVNGENVNLSISTNNDRMSQERPDVVKVQSTDTTVSGKLGEWITVAGINQQSQSERSASSLTYSTQRGENMTLRVKVDALD